MSAIGRAELEQRLTAAEIDRNLWAARWRRASGEREALSESADFLAEAARRLAGGDRSEPAWAALDEALKRWNDVRVSGLPPDSGRAEELRDRAA